MNSNGLPAVDVEKCTACGDCVDACPRDLFEIMPLSQKLFVQCNAPLAGEAVRVMCAVACDACGCCAADAAPGLIRMENNLPVIDYTAGGPARPEATYRCPPGTGHEHATRHTRCGVCTGTADIGSDMVFLPERIPGVGSKRCGFAAYGMDFLLGPRRGMSLRDNIGLLTGLLLGLTLPPAIPLWMAFLGEAVSIGLGKEI